MRKYLTIPVFGLVVAGVGIVVPILWDLIHIHRNFDVQLLSSISLVGDDPIKKDLTVSYNGTEVQNITKFVYRFANTGRQPLSDLEIKEFPSLTFAPPTKIIAAEVIKKDPPELTVQTQIDLVQDKLSTEFGLMNPTDFFDVAVYVTGDPKDDPSLAGRITGVKRIIVQKDDRNASSLAIARQKNPWVYYPVLVFTTIFGLSGAYGLRQLIRQLALRRRLKSVPQLLDFLQEKWQFERFIALDMTFLASSQRERLQKMLLGWTSEADAVDAKEQLRNNIRALIQRDNTVFASLVFIVLLFGFGIFYLQS